MLSFFEKLPNAVKALLLVAFVSIGIGISGKDFINEKSGLNSPSQSDQKDRTNSEDITVRILVLNKKNQAPIPAVAVNLERPGIPVPTDYTDNAGYVDIKIPKTEYIKVRLSKVGFQNSTWRVSPDIKDRNSTYYMEEDEIKPISPAASVPQQTISPSTQPEKANQKTELSQTNNNNLVAEVNGFRVQAQSCSIKSGNVTCSLQITSLEEDSPISLIKKQSRIISSGTEYFSDAARFGNINSFYSNGQLIKNQPTNAYLVFSKVGDVSTVEVLEVTLHAKGYSDFPVRLFNIPVSK